MIIDRSQYPVKTISALLYRYLLEDGGITIMHEPRQQGYLVSNSRYSATIPGDTSGKESITIIQHWIVKNSDVPHSCGYGIWINPDDDTIYLDVLYYFTELNAAIKFARKHNQTAFYSLHEHKSILTPNPEPPAHV